MNVIIANERRRLESSHSPTKSTDTESSNKPLHRRASTHDVGDYRHKRKNSLTSMSIKPTLDQNHHDRHEYRGFCGIKTTRCASQRGELRVWLYQSDEGAAWDVWIMLLCLISVFVFVIQTYIEDEPNANGTNNNTSVSNVYIYFGNADGQSVFGHDILCTTIVIEFICACFFTLDLCLNLFAAKSPLLYLFCGWGLIDLLTCAPVFVEASLPPGFCGKNDDADLLNILSLLRFARVFKVTRFLREMRLQRMLKTHVSLMTSQIISSIIVIGAIWLLFTSLVYVAEVEIPMYFYKLAAKRQINSNGTAMAPFVKSISFGKAFYFSIVTFSTVGFGDISPQTTIGQWVVIVMIIIGLASIAHRVAEVGYLLGSISKYSHRVVPGEAGHILVMGYCKNSQIVQHFLDEHLHPDHFGKVSSFLGPEDVVLVGMGDPPESLVQDVLQSSHYGGKVRYFKGSLMSQKDLHSMELRKASAIFLLSDLHSNDPKGEDAKTVVSALVLRDFDADARIFAEVHGKEAAQHLSQLVRPNAVVCIDELRAHLMAATVNLPGLSTLFDNLCCAFSRPDPDPRRPSWLSEYFEGADKELYRIRCPSTFAGMSFVDVALHMFEASTYEGRLSSASSMATSGTISATASKTNLFLNFENEMGGDRQVILVAVDIDDELFTNPGDWFHLPTSKLERKSVHQHHNASMASQIKKKGGSFSRNDNDNDTFINNSNNSNGRTNEKHQYLPATFLYVIASDKEHAAALEQITNSMWLTIKKEILERSMSDEIATGIGGHSTIRKVGSFKLSRSSMMPGSPNSVDTQGKEEEQFETIDTSEEEEEDNSKSNAHPQQLPDSTTMWGSQEIELPGLGKIEEKEDDEEEEEEAEKKEDKKDEKDENNNENNFENNNENNNDAHTTEHQNESKNESLVEKSTSNNTNSSKEDIIKQHKSASLGRISSVGLFDNIVRAPSIGRSSRIGGSFVSVTERAAERGWWRIDGQRCEPGFHPSQLNNHVIICGAIRELGSFASTLRHLRHRALLTVGEKVRSMHDVVMPIIVLAEQSREEATVEWGLLGAKKSQLNDTYHVQESASTEMGLHAAGIKNAKYILIVADPERNGMRGYSDSTTAGADGGDGNNGGGSTSGNSSSFGGGTDHEDVKTLITYLAIDNCLGDIPMHQRPTIVCEAGSTMSMHVLSSRRFARISDQRISGDPTHNASLSNGNIGSRSRSKTRRRSSTMSARLNLLLGTVDPNDIETETLDVDIHLGSHPSGSYHRSKIPRPPGYVPVRAKDGTPVGSQRRSSGWQPHQSQSPKPKSNICSWLIHFLVRCCVTGSKSCCAFCCKCAAHRHVEGSEHNGRNFLGIPFFSAGFAFTSRFVDTLVVQARYTPGLLEVFECLTAVRSPLIEAYGDKDEEEDGENKVNDNNIRSSKSDPNPNSQPHSRERSESSSLRETEKRDLGSIQKIEVPIEFIGQPYRLFFREMARDYGIIPIALYRGVDIHENDNKLPYVYTCPSPDAPLMEGDSAFVLVKPKRITRNRKRGGGGGGSKVARGGKSFGSRKSHRLRRGSIV